MKTSNILVVGMLALAVACKAPEKKEQKIPTLTFKWKTDTLLTTCESVCYDSVNNVLYVSDINGDPSVKDGNGFISRVSLDGKILDAKWVTGLDAPKGLGIYNGKLYAADVDQIVEISIDSARITHKYPVDSAKFLNDITVSSDGKVYVSDTQTGVISVLDHGTVSTWLTGLKSPNGLLAEDSRMLELGFADSTFNAINMATMDVTPVAHGFGNADGLEAAGDSAYLVSSWNGMIHYVTADGMDHVLLDTRADSVSSADIEYIASKHLLLIPTFFKNAVTAYELTTQP